MYYNIILGSMLFAEEAKLASSFWDRFLHPGLWKPLQLATIYLFFSNVLSGVPYSQYLLEVTERIKDDTPISAEWAVVSTLQSHYDHVICVLYVYNNTLNIFFSTLRSPCTRRAASPETYSPFCWWTSWGRGACCCRPSGCVRCPSCSSESSDCFSALPTTRPGPNWFYFSWPWSARQWA